MRNITKFLIALAGIAIPFANQMGIPLPDFLTVDWLQGLILAITPAAVYYFPNKPKAAAGAVTRVPWQIALLALFFGAMLSGCGLSNPFKYAETPEQRYVAVSGTYEIALETAEKIVANDATPLEVVRAIDDTQKRTTPVMDALDQAFLDYMIAKADLAVGETTDGRLRILSQNLELYLDQAMRAYRDLAAATD